MNEYNISELVEFISSTIFLIVMAVFIVKLYIEPLEEKHRENNK